MLAQTHDTAERIKTRIEELVGAQRFKVWFKNSTQLSCGDGFVKVGVPNLFIGGWIEDHFTDAIAKAAMDVTGREVQVSFPTDPLLFRGLRKTQLNSQADFIEKNAERSIRDVRGKT
jgi:chromosomal replication initiator protein